MQHHGPVDVRQGRANRRVQKLASWLRSSPMRPVAAVVLGAWQWLDAIAEPSPQRQAACKNAEAAAPGIGPTCTPVRFDAS